MKIANRKPNRKSVAFVLVALAIVVATASAHAQNITLKVLIEDVPDTHYIAELLPDFREKTGLDIEFEVVQYLDMHSKLVTQFISRQARYDVIAVDNYWAGEFCAAGWLAPIDEYVARDGFDINPYIESGLDMVGFYEDTLYMLPIYNYACILVYREDLLTDPRLQGLYRAEYGKELLMPDDLEEYVELCSFMDEHAGDGIVGVAMQAGRGDPIVMEWSNYLFALGGEYFDENWHSVVNSDIGIKATELYIKNTKNAQAGVLAANIDDVNRVMTQGKAFSTINFPWQMPTFDDPAESRVAGLVEIFPIPGGSGLNGSWGWGIGYNTQYKEEAWEFIKWVESPEIAKKRAMAGGTPTRMDVYNDEEFKDAYPWCERLPEIIGKAKHIPQFQFSSQMVELLGRELSMAATGEKSIVDALNEAARELDALAKQANLYK